MFRKILINSLPLLAFLLGVCYFCLRILGIHLENIPGDLGDSRFIAFVLEHGYRWICGETNGFWDGGFMYPFQNTLALSDSMLGTLPFYSLWRFMGFSPETSYQLWWICMCALNYWCAYWVFKKWFARVDIAVIAAWIFAFTILNLGQLNYMQMIVRFMVPVVFYAAYRMLTTPSAAHLALYCAGIVIQIYSAVYTGFYLLYFSLLFIFLYCLLSGKWKVLLYYFSKRVIAYSALSVISSLAVLLWLLLPYLKMSDTVGLRLYSEIRVYLPEWKSFLFAHPSSTLWGFLFPHMKPDISDYWLHHTFAGMIPLLVLIGGPVFLLISHLKKQKVNIWLKVAIIAATLIALVHLRVGENITLYGIIFKLPGINSMKVTTRFMNTEIFLILLTFCFLMQKLKPKWLILVAALVLADNLFNPTRIPVEKKSEWQARREFLSEELSRKNLNNYTAVAYINEKQPFFITHLDIMLAAQSLDKPCVNGYSSYCPDAYGRFFLNTTEENLDYWLNETHVDKKQVLIIRK